MPLLSIIIPTFNRRELLRRTLASIPASDDVGVIVVDDGSTDGTMEMLRSMGGQVMAIQQSQQGPGAARNRGAAAASGEYLAFLDSDDLWFEWTPAAYRKTIERHNRPAFIAGKPKIFNDESELAAEKCGELQTLAFGDYLASGDEWRWWGASSFVIRRDAFNVVDGFCSRSDLNGEDHDLAMKLGTAAGFVQIQAPSTFAYRRHPGSAMRDMPRTYAGLQLAIDQEAAGRYPGGPGRRGERLQILCRQLRAGSAQLLDAGYKHEAMDIYRRTWKWNAQLGRWKYLLGFGGRLLLGKSRADKR
ncbi:MAG TPA: glycosyltransferase [Tepidisphaeraceae bacterium]|nr:glycosyltransferase [Tepidisphaeraceae bacterium]